MFGITQIKNAVTDVKSFLGKAVSDASEVVKLWNAIQNNGTKALILKISADVLAEVANAEGAVASGGLNITLDEACFTGAKQLIADATAGKASAVADLQALGLDVPKAAAVAAVVIPPAAVALPAATPPAPAAAVPAPASSMEEILSAIGKLLNSALTPAPAVAAIPATTAAATPPVVAPILPHEVVLA
jgi:hypothetical protein